MVDSPATLFRTLNIKDFKNAKKNEIELLEKASHWDMCCCTKPTDSRLLKFIAQYLLIFMVLTFSLYKLGISTSCEDSTLWLSVLTLILGIILPAPSN